MARPRTKARKSYEEQLEENEAKIQKHEAALKGLKQEREILLKAKRDAQMQQLYEYMEQNHMSAEDILNSLQSGPM